MLSPGHIPLSTIPSQSPDQTMLESFFSLLLSHYLLKPWLLVHGPTVEMFRTNKEVPTPRITILITMSFPFGPDIESGRKFLAHSQGKQGQCECSGQSQWYCLHTSFLFVAHDLVLTFTLSLLPSDLVCFLTCYPVAPFLNALSDLTTHNTLWGLQKILYWLHIFIGHNLNSLFRVTWLLII